MKTNIKIRIITDPPYCFEDRGIESSEIGTVYEDYEKKIYQIQEIELKPIFIAHTYSTINVREFELYKDFKLIRSELLPVKNMPYNGSIKLSGVRFSLQKENLCLDLEVYQKIIEDVDKYLVDYRSWPFGN